MSERTDHAGFGWRRLVLGRVLAGEGDEGEEGGLLASLFARMDTPYGFRVVCEGP